METVEYEVEITVRGMDADGNYTDKKSTAFTERNNMSAGEHAKRSTDNLVCSLMK